MVSCRRLSPGAVNTVIDLQTFSPAFHRAAMQWFAGGGGTSPSWKPCVAKRHRDTSPSCTLVLHTALCNFLAIGSSFNPSDESTASFKARKKHCPGRVVLQHWKAFRRRVAAAALEKKNRRILIGYDAHFYDIASRLFPKNFFKIIWILPFMRELLKFKKDNHDRDT